MRQDMIARLEGFAATDGPTMAPSLTGGVYESGALLGGVAAGPLRGADGDAGGGGPRATGAIPRGFANVDAFASFANDMRAGLRQAGYDDVQPIFQGSAVTGHKYGQPDQPFDVGRTSDFDIALASPTLLQQAKDLGIRLRSQGTRSGPLSEQQLRDLGLYDLSQQLKQQAAGRQVNFMIYESAETAINRAPSIPVP